MKFRDIYLGIIFAFGTILIGCSSGEYELEETTTENVQKTLKYDTLEIVKDTSTKKEEIVSKYKPESFTFIVQIGAFRVPGNFQKFFDEARAKLGDEVYNSFINDLNKIRIGRFNNRADALKLLDYVKSQGYYDAFIITIINK